MIPPVRGPWRSQGHRIKAERGRQALGGRSQSLWGLGLSLGGSVGGQGTTAQRLNILKLNSTLKTGYSGKFYHEFQNFSYWLC